MDEWHGYLECGKCWGIRRPYITPPELGEEVCPDCKGDYGIQWIKPFDDDVYYGDYDEQL